METTHQQTSNIPSTGWKVTNNSGLHERRLVSFNTEATFSLSYFSVRQLILGEVHLHGMKVFNDEDLFKKMAIYSLDAPRGEEKHTACIDLSRAEVQQLRVWLEARMTHCEKERDEDNNIEAAFIQRVGAGYTEDKPTPKFKPDTYIAQKFLLLDIREWLLGEIID